MKLLIIGHSVEDYIHTEGKEILQPGGIFYTAYTMNLINEDEDEIYLCSSVEENNYNLFASAYDNLNKKYLSKVKAIPKVHLNINPGKEREETYENITENLDTEFEDINSFDAILINMITGFDISLDQLKKLRAVFNGLIYMDVHTLTRGVGKHMHRFFRKIPRFDEWASNIDIIQVNRTEVLSLSKYEDELNTAKEILKKEGQILIVTKDELGAKYFTLRNDEIISTFKKAIDIKVNNKIGFGDVFGAVFFYSYIKNKNPDESLIKANAAAGVAASYPSLNDFKKLKYDILSRHN